MGTVTDKAIVKCGPAQQVKKDVKNVLLQHCVVQDPRRPDVLPRCLLAQRIEPESVTRRTSLIVPRTEQP